MDSMFWKESGLTNNANPTPMLVIVDVATKFTKIYIQDTKNDQVLEHYLDFKKALKKRFKNTTDKTILITDDAKELAKPFKDHKDVFHKVSTGINKAVLAESKIRQIRQILRTVELEVNLANLSKDSEVRIDKDGLKLIKDKIEEAINKTTYQRQRPIKTPTKKDNLRLGNVVFALNLQKYYPHQTKDILRKKSYDGNWYYEPFIISKIVTFNGISKYEITAIEDNQKVKYYFYSDMLQKIDPRVASEYVKNYVSYFNKRKDRPDFL
jgi:hypothetical protein